MKKLMVVLGAMLVFGCGDAEPKTNNANNVNNVNNINNVNNVNNANNTNNANNVNNGQDYDVCETHAACVLQTNTCCGVCGIPSAADTVAINSDFVDDYREELCSDPVQCPDCPQGLNPYLVPTCEAGRCKVMDLEVDEVSACETTDECVLRSSECCECGGDTIGKVIGLNATQVDAYENRVCDPFAACLECAPNYEQFETECVEGRCIVHFLE